MQQSSLKWKAILARLDVKQENESPAQSGFRAPEGFLFKWRVVTRTRNAAITVELYRKDNHCLLFVTIQLQPGLRLILQACLPCFRFNMKLYYHVIQYVRSVTCLTQNETSRFSSRTTKSHVFRMLSCSEDTFFQ